jgi:hypothetical protein
MFGEGSFFDGGEGPGHDDNPGARFGCRWPFIASSVGRQWPNFLMLAGMTDSVITVEEVIDGFEMDMSELV